MEEFNLDQLIFCEKPRRLEDRIASGSRLEAKGLIYDDKNNLYMVKFLDNGELKELWKRIGGTEYYVYVGDNETIVSEYLELKQKPMRALC